MSFGDEVHPDPSDVSGGAHDVAATRREPERDLFGKTPVGRSDWSHRRREPRGLALAWTVYLMLATVVSLIPMVLSGQLSGDVYRPAARVMIVLVVIGLAVLWPVLRVSQSPNNRRPVLEVTRDLGVLFLPAMVLLWPQAVLAGWSASVVGAASVVSVVWGLISATPLLWWHRHSRGGQAGRFVPTVVSLVIVAAVPLVLAIGGSLSLGRATDEPSDGWLWTPVTAIWEVLRERPWTGVPAAVSPEHWSVLRVQSIAALAVYLVSAVACRGSGAAESRQQKRMG